MPETPFRIFVDDTLEGVYVIECGEWKAKSSEVDINDTAGQEREGKTMGLAVAGVGLIEKCKNRTQSSETCRKRGWEESKQIH